MTLLQFHSLEFSAAHDGAEFQTSGIVGHYRGLVPILGVIRSRGGEPKKNLKHSNSFAEDLNNNNSPTISNAP